MELLTLVTLGTNLVLIVGGILGFSVYLRDRRRHRVRDHAEELRKAAYVEAVEGAGRDKSGGMVLTVPLPLRSELDRQAAFELVWDGCGYVEGDTCWITVERFPSPPRSAPPLSAILRRFPPRF